MVDNLLVSSPHADKIFSWGIPQTPLKNRTVNFEKCTKCKLGDWGFPQSVKSQKSVCGGALQIGLEEASDISDQLRLKRAIQAHQKHLKTLQA